MTAVWSVGVQEDAEVAAEVADEVAAEVAAGLAAGLAAALLDVAYAGPGES